MPISKIRPKILSCWPWDLLHNIFCDWPIQLYCTYTTMFFSTFILPIIVQPKNIYLFFFIQTSKWPSIIRIWYFVGSKRVSSSNKNEFFIWEILGVAIGRLCDKCDGRCVICDSYVRPSTLVRICDECNYGSFQVKILNLRPNYYKRISNIIYFRDDVLFVEVQVFPMHTTAKSVLF